VEEQVEERLRELDSLIERLKPIYNYFEGVAKGVAVYKGKDYPLYSLITVRYKPSEFVEVLRWLFRLVKPARLCLEVENFRKSILLPSGTPEIVLLSPAMCFKYGERAVFVFGDRVVYRKKEMFWDRLESHAKTLGETLLHVLAFSTDKSVRNVKVNLDSGEIEDIEEFFGCEHAS